MRRKGSKYAGYTDSQGNNIFSSSLTEQRSAEKRLKAKKNRLAELNFFD